MEALMDVSPRVIKRTAAATGLLLITPAALFMTALMVRALQPLQDEPANAAQKIVMWYSLRPWTLWVLLIALPLGVLVLELATLMYIWNDEVRLGHSGRRSLAAMRSSLTTVLVAAAMLTAGGILLVVVLHMLAN
jgi:hypothetical protein